MNYKIIALIACMLNSSIFGIPRPIITICNQSTLLAFIESIVRNKIPGKIKSRGPDLKYLEFYNPDNVNQPKIIVSLMDVYSYRYNRPSFFSIFQKKEIKKEFELTKEDARNNIHKIGISDPNKERKIAHIMLCHIPGIIESNPGTGTVTVHYHDKELDEVTETEQSKK